MPKDRYDIVRFYKDDRENEVIKEDVTWAEALKHCKSPDTTGDGWFDGWRKVEEE